jgi:xanthine dehydrogenase accessory factor
LRIGTQDIPILVRGGGDLASGVVFRLARAGFRVVISELAQPLAVRRSVSFAEAVYQGEITIEGVRGSLVEGIDAVKTTLAVGDVPVIIDPEAEIRHSLKPLVIVDGRMTKKTPDLSMDSATLMIGMGPGFIAGSNCHAVVETKRGFTLGRVYWQGSADADSGVPEAVGSYEDIRVLRSPADGQFHARHAIGDWIEEGGIIADVSGHSITAKFAGILRGLLHPGLNVKKGVKVGDLDPRQDPRLSVLISDKSLSIGGAVLEAIFTRFQTILDIE